MKNNNISKIRFLLKRGFNRHWCCGVYGFTTWDYVGIQKGTRISSFKTWWCFGWKKMYKVIEDGPIMVYIDEGQFNPRLGYKQPSPEKNVTFRRKSVKNRKFTKNLTPKIGEYNEHRDFSSGSFDNISTHDVYYS